MSDEEKSSTLTTPGFQGLLWSRRSPPRQPLVGRSRRESRRHRQIRRRKKTCQEGTGAAVSARPAKGWHSAQHKGLISDIEHNDTQHNKTAIMLNAGNTVLSVAIYLFVCWMSLCWMSLCWVSLCWVWWRHLHSLLVFDFKNWTELKIMKTHKNLLVPEELKYLEWQSAEMPLKVTLEKSYWRGRRFSTVDLLVLANLNQLLFTLKISFTYFIKQATLMRSTVLSLPPSVSSPCWQIFDWAVQ